MSLGQLIFSLAVCVVFAEAADAKPRSIVGTWRAPRGNCEIANGATIIKPMSLQNEDIVCKFSSVKRVAQTVIWTGTCDDAEGFSDQTVTAIEMKGRLRLIYNPGGNIIEDLVRCDR